MEGNRLVIWLKPIVLVVQESSQRGKRNPIALHAKQSYVHFSVYDEKV